MNMCYSWVSILRQESFHNERELESLMTRKENDAQKTLLSRGKLLQLIEW